MTYDELKRKYEDFKARFFRAGKLKKKITDIDACLTEMEDPFTFEITIYPYQESDKAVTFEIETPEKVLCEPLRGLMGQFKVIHLRKLDQLGVKD